MLYQPIEYDCGDGVSIRRCPALKSLPEFWYIKMGFTNVSYWTEEGWRDFCPMQFPTAQEAIDYHKAHAEEINA